MTFRETLDKHMEAIASRNMEALIETLPRDELLLVMSDGKVARTTLEFTEAHRAWFQMPNWQLDAQRLHVRETQDVGIAVFRLDYSDLGADGKRFHQFSILTLVFARENGRWLMVQDQNTPIKEN